MMYQKYTYLYPLSLLSRYNAIISLWFVYSVPSDNNIIWATKSRTSKSIENYQR